MSFRVKSALIAAVLGICSFTAAFAGDVTGADDASSLAGRPPVTHLSAAPAAAAQTIRFAPRKEVVQPLGRQTEVAADSTPRAGDLIAVPDGNYESLAAMVRDTDTSASLDKETRCLASAIFYEARSESLEGQLAVGRVIVNRANLARFGDDMCDVITQPGQFSFVRGGVIPAPNASRPAWKTAIAIARIAQNNAWASKAEGALFFHARRLSPGWGRAKVATIDNHIFYR